MDKALVRFVMDEKEKIESIDIWEHLEHLIDNFFLERSYPIALPSSLGRTGCS